DGQTVHLADLPAEIALLSGAAPQPQPQPAAALPGLTSDESAEAARIRAALEQARYRRDEAAQLLGMSRTTLWRKIKTYRL
ncbi:MAG TPA: helix-turn-helix domain-containing protein, partial [Longimicrobiaceae bacterium]